MPPPDDRPSDPGDGPADTGPGRRSALVDGRLLAGRYRVGPELGSGGMATVHAAVDTRLDRTVAVKALRPEMAARHDVRARFEAEARSAARLAHPNVVGVFDSGEDDGLAFIVMERLPGETLADRMTSGSADPDWLLRVADDVLGALGAAHRAGVVHRDVKPGNILLAEDGCAKVADFGIAKSLDVADAADLTSSGLVVGTPAYLSPEQIEGRPASPRSDLYALGVVLYEALAGKKPFSGATPMETADAVHRSRPVPLAESCPDLPDHIVAAVDRAMSRDPEQRFASAEEMSAALRVAGRDETVLAAPVAADATTVMPLGAVPVSALVPEAVPQPIAESSRGGLGLLSDRRRLLAVAAAGLVAALILLGLAAGRSNDATTPTAPPVATVPAAAQTPDPTTTVAPAPAAPAKAKGKGKGKDDD